MGTFFQVFLSENASDREEMHFDVSLELQMKEEIQKSRSYKAKIKMEEYNPNGK